MKITQDEDIAKLVRRGGVVGAGGAGFPTHIKITVKGVDTVIINAAECEPLLASDKYLIKKEYEAVLRGLELIMKACGAYQGYIGIKKKYEDIIYSLNKEITGRSNISLFELDDYYPAGDEFLLVYEITGRIVPEKGIPPSVGCLVNNVETAYNVYRAVELNIPVTRRYLTCTGEVKKPSIVRAHIGTPIGEIIELCGGPTVEDPVIIKGGPIMGTLETDLDEPVTKMMGGIIVLPQEHPAVYMKRKSLDVIVKQSKAACCQCTYCTELCPRYLLGHELKPHIIMRQIGYGIDFPTGTIESAVLCSGCGLCEVYACVMGLSPKKVIDAIKYRLNSNGYKPDFREREILVHDMRDYRKIPAGRIIQRLKLSSYENKNLREIIETDPKRVEILLKQHFGEPARPIVNVGDVVEEGSLIADVPPQTLGVPVHSSISGKVTFIDEEKIIIQKD